MEWLGQIDHTHKGKRRVGFKVRSVQRQGQGREGSGKRKGNSGQGKGPSVLQEHKVDR